MLTFICGGVRSGKSRIGENIAEKNRITNESRLIYLATCRYTDEEMIKRIQHHKLDRRNRNGYWITIEQPTNIDTIVGRLKKKDIVFLDCLTTWLSNEMFYDYSDICSNHIKHYMKETVEQLEASCAHLIIISNDIFHEPVPVHKETYLYMQILGELHQYFVQQAKNVIEMEAGKPLLRKGEYL
ncbi:adenosylcobinamide kinase/adenosylcobinamide-phosphate guanylyltransferase [Salibacterium salarium]|uniref:bifunctional adenosylcobinamide kinase/adenosylcobinamide-phosphate guanylyltransferase n=1 Tax=Salibacterium salarium TaxID=284579 RepID=UPI002780EF1B|nr:bifunctional adenosylcobinamide kinase/adenosylcobinamide-phosphate guanylyltransferase [Salibacterium salarium]MDQ0299488.1 adenosylcobinamide kinase/adenosylcobinamide-phosphate guanylyltransferase [Salibacterium salarium]